jgi:hypothetical protein
MEKFRKEKYSLAVLIAVLLIRIILKPEYFPVRQEQSQDIWNRER